MFYRIGQAARKLGVSEHSLRQWARRYNIAASHRTEGGQRLYNSEDLERLELIVAGRDQGLRLSDMAQLSIAGLHEATGQASERRPGIYWQGSSQRRLQASYPDIEWLTEDPGYQIEGLRIYELETVTEEDLDTLAPSVSGRDWIIYEYASRPMQKRMSEAGFRLFRGPVSDDWISALLQELLPVRQFSNEELQHFREVRPNLECECPNHVAGILQQLRHFAQYSLECKSQNAQQAWVHQQIYRHIRDAQQDVEAALRLIVEEEGL